MTSGQLKLKTLNDNPYGRAGDDVHGARRDRDDRSLSVLGGSRGSRGSRVNGLVAAAGDSESQGKEHGEEIMESANGVVVFLDIPAGGRRRNLFGEDGLGDGGLEEDLGVGVG